MSPIHIAHILPSLALDRGGPPRSVAGLCRAQASLGAEVTFVVGGGQPQPEPSSTQLDGVKVIYGNHMPLPFEIPALSMVRLIRRAVSKADIIHIHSIWNGTVTTAATLCRHQGKPYVLSPRGMLDKNNVQHRKYFKKAYQLLIERHTLAGAAGWHFLDVSERADCCWPPRKYQGVIIAPNGLDVESIQTIAKTSCQEVLKNPDPSLVFLGRLHSIKGLEIQVEALQILRESAIRATLYLIGPDDGVGENIVKFAHRLNVSDHVKRVGPIYNGERYAILREATAVLLTSHYECNAVAAAETLAAGGLLVATDSCNLDTVAAAGAAIVVPRNPTAVANAIMDILAQPQRAQQIRAAALAYSAQYLDWSILAQRILEFYGSVIERHSQSAACVE